MEDTRKKRVSPKQIMPIILGMVLVGAIIFGIKEFVYFSHHVDTDDAQVDGDISPVVSRVGGYVKEIRFRDNQYVNLGDTLVVLDDRDYRIKLEEAEAALAAARSGVGVSRSTVVSTRASLATAQSNIDEAKVKVWKTTQDYTRYLSLLKQQAITQAQFDAVKADQEAAQAQLAAAENQLTVIGSQVGTSREQVAASQSGIAIQQANVDYAKLQLSYTVITAPASGIVSRRDIQIGELVQAGQSLFAIVDTNDIYVTANFKETQLYKLKAGDQANIRVDAYPGQVLQGTVNSFSGATGARFSLLPPDNATGNFVKVVQRIPVKIVLPHDPSLIDKLRPGMSVSVSVPLK
ncbi:MAG TPA: HlyD family secretion protein [Chitinophagaceae bacterium]|nr:HlyD family secretion protein [Chitinophagaceae bacterium]